MLTPEVAERLARVEERVDTVIASVDDLKETQATIQNSVQSISTDIKKYQGFIGGVVFIVSAMWGIFVLAVGKFFPSVTGHGP